LKENAKSRVVTFRLAEREYESLKTACGKDQSSISVIARKTLLAWAESLTLGPAVDHRLAEIEKRLESLCSMLGMKNR
jgi:hypothetical protein